MKRYNQSTATAVKTFFTGASMAALIANSGALADAVYRPGAVSGTGTTMRIEGYVAHGVNVFNNQFIADYTSASPSVPWLNPNPPLYEIGVFVEGADDSEVISADTDAARLVATNRRFVDLFGLGVDPTLFNRTLDKVDSNYFGSQTITDRIVPLSFDDATEATVYRRVGINPAPSLEEWNKVSGLITYKCLKDGTATVRVSIVDAFPNAVYTMWDVGAKNPLTDQEQGYAVPLGGLPNILKTNDKGCASVKVRVPYCPGRPCQSGATSCSSYLSIAHHWDQQTYGASPAASLIGIPVGAYAANHMVWPMSGNLLQEPHNRWNAKVAARDCKK